MTREEAEEYAKTMTFWDAICNLAQAKCIPYRKATFIKVNELLKALEQQPCDDVVSRQAIMKLKRHNLVEGQFVSLYDIERLPSVRPQEPRENDEISERNLKMWQDIFEEEKRRTE